MARVGAPSLDYAAPHETGAAFERTQPLYLDSGHTPGARRKHDLRARRGLLCRGPSRGNEGAVGGPGIDHSLLVEVFLFEGDPEAAWKEALLGGCSRGLWLALAERRERSHPEEALVLYKQELERTLTQANQAAYETAVRLLRKIHGVLSRTGQKERFHLYLASVSAAHARKRNFVRLLGETRWA